MGKKDITNNDNDRYPSDDSIESYEQSRKEDNKNFPKKIDAKTVTIVHKRNTKKELHIGRKVYTFWGHISLEVPIEVISHPDFKSQEKYFLIKEEINAS